MTQTVVVETLRELHKLLNAPNIHVKNLVDSLGEKIILSFAPLHDELTDSPNINLVLALLTTAYGRIILYKLLAHAGRKAKYADTGNQTPPLPPSKNLSLKFFF
jgi:hypothetical protein